MPQVKHASPLQSIVLNRFSSIIVYMSVGGRIKEVRQRFGLTQEELGKLAGVSKAAVSQWERESSRPERDALLSLKQRRGISPEWITSGKGSMLVSESATENGAIAEFSYVYEHATDRGREILRNAIAMVRELYIERRIQNVAVVKDRRSE